MNKNQLQTYYENSKNKFRIFQIGFNKCGTRSLNHLFKKNGIKTIHYGGGKIAETMFKHYKKNEPLIDIRYRNITFFSDMESIVNPETPLYVSQHLFKNLYYQYPNSIFILNIRNKDNWIKSRLNHGSKSNEVKYLKIIMSKMNMSRKEVIKLWSEEWDTHIKNVKEFFNDKPNKLIIYNIETEPIDVLITKLKPYININKELYKHIGKTNI